MRKVLAESARVPTLPLGPSSGGSFTRGGAKLCNTGRRDPSHHELHQHVDEYLLPWRLVNGTLQGALPPGAPIQFGFPRHKLLEGMLEELRNVAAVEVAQADPQMKSPVQSG